MKELPTRNLEELQISRGIAILAVLLVHGTSTAIVNVPQDSIYFPFYNLLHSFGRLGTPTFIMLSSFILFYSYYHREFSNHLITSFFKKRLQYILVPYVVISIFYFLIKWQVLSVSSYSTAEEAWNDFQYDLLFGKAHPHLYFVFVSVQFYLLFPLFLWAMKKSKLLRSYAIPIGLIIQLFWLYGNTTYEWIPKEFSIVFSYAALYFLGAYLGIHYDSLLHQWKLRSTKLVALVVTVFFMSGFFGFAFTAYNYLEHIGVWPQVARLLPSVFGEFYYRVLWLSYTIFMSVSILFVANYLTKVGGRFKASLLLLGSLSFGIYLIHPFYLMILRPVFETSPIGIFHVYQGIILMVTLLISGLTVYVVYRFLPFHWILFGKSTITPSKTKKY